MSFSDVPQSFRYFVLGPLFLLGLSYLSVRMWSLTIKRYRERTASRLRPTTSLPVAEDSQESVLRFGFTTQPLPPSRHSGE